MLLAQVRVWDVRMYKPRHAYFSHAPVDALDISQRGLLALGHGRTVQVGACWAFQCWGLVKECACELHMLTASRVMRSWSNCSYTGVGRSPHHECSFPLLVFRQAPLLLGLGRAKPIIQKALPARRCGRTRLHRSSSRRTCARRWRAAAFAACASAPTRRALTLQVSGSKTSTKLSPSLPARAWVSAQCSGGGGSQT